LNSKEFTELKEEQKEEYLEKKGIKVVKFDIVAFQPLTDIHTSFTP